VTFVMIRSTAAVAADEEQKNFCQPYGDYYAWNELPPLTGVQMVVVVVVALWISWWSTATATVVSRRERWTGRWSTDAMSEF
jgi:hypothetical protein